MAYEDDPRFTPPEDPGPLAPDPFVAQLTALYAKYGRTPTPEDIQIHRGNPGGLPAIDALLKKDQPVAATTGGSGGGAGGGGNTLPNPFGSTFTAPSPVNLGGPAGIPYVPPTPTFTPPTYEKPPAFQYQPFTAPNASDVLADPSYNFRLSQGLGAISNSEAARGLWASGQTGKAFNDYAQNVASTEYGKVYDRGLNSYMTNFNNALNTYATNAQSQYNQPYQYAYQSAKDQFAPEILGYQTQAAAGQRQSEFDYTNAYNKWLADFDQKYKTGTFLQGVANS